MWDFSVGRSVGLMAQTLPFILFRMAVYFGITVALILTTGVGAGFGYGIGAFGPDDFQATATFWGGAVGFVGVTGVVFFFRDYLLYLVKAGHIAVMVELLRGGRVPEGRGQIAHATAAVRARFGEASALFALDRIVHGVITAITGIIEGLLTILPIPGLDRLAGILRAYLRVAVGLVDEMIIAHAFRTGSDNPWANAREGLVLYAQNARPMLKNAAWLTAIAWGLAVIVFVVMLVPAAAVVWLFPGEPTGATFVFAVVFAWAFKAALIEPFCVACLMQAFFKVTDGQTPRPDWDAKLSEVSDKFRHIGEQAASWMGSGLREARAQG